MSDLDHEAETVREDLGRLTLADQFLLEALDDLKREKEELKSELKTLRDDAKAEREKYLFERDIRERENFKLRQEEREEMEKMRESYEEKLKEESEKMEKMRENYENNLKEERDSSEKKLKEERESFQKKLKEESEKMEKMRESYVKKLKEESESSENKLKEEKESSEKKLKEEKESSEKKLWEERVSLIEKNVTLKDKLWEEYRLRLKKEAEVAVLEERVVALFPEHTGRLIGLRLGSGSRGTVYELGMRHVIKVFTNSDDGKIEKMNIERVRQTIEADPSVPLPIPKVEIDLLDVSALLLSPRGERQGGTIASFLNLLDFIQKLHVKVNVVHGDIRPSNIVVVNRDFVLIDWGNSAEIGIVKACEGSFFTAPDDLLPKLDLDENNMYEVHPRHDLESLVKSYFLITHTVRSDKLAQPPLTKGATIKDIKSSVQGFWRDYEKISERYMTAINYAKECNYAAVADCIGQEVYFSLDVCKW